MKISRHGLTIGLERINSNLYLSLKAVGKLSHADYQTITPMIDSALQGVKDPAINVLFDASELDGWELRAAWDDFKLGLKHGNKFNRIAIVGHKRWLEMSSKIGAWFVSGEVKYFEDLGEAIDWLGTG